MNTHYIKNERPNDNFTMLNPAESILYAVARDREIQSESTLIDRYLIYCQREAQNLSVSPNSIRTMIKNLVSKKFLKELGGDKLGKAISNIR